jgi:hypothetical protein
MHEALASILPIFRKKKTVFKIIIYLEATVGLVMIMHEKKHSRNVACYF